MNPEILAGLLILVCVLAVAALVVAIWAMVRNSSATAPQPPRRPYGAVPRVSETRVRGDARVNTPQRQSAANPPPLPPRVVQPVFAPTRFVLNRHGEMEELPMSISTNRHGELDDSN
ncbi:MAG: hypothetical protein HUU55_10115 [Myxococcales bacterium]|nr:hypothetical protein [Myxococcales bacterium]